MKQPFICGSHLVHAAGAILMTWTSLGGRSPDRGSRPDDVREARARLDRGAERVALIVPRGFARKLSEGRTAPVQTLVDGSYSVTATILQP